MSPSNDTSISPFPFSSPVPASAHCVLAFALTASVELLSLMTT